MAQKFNPKDSNDIEIIDLTPENITEYGVCGYKDMKKAIILKFSLIPDYFSLCIAQDFSRFIPKLNRKTVLFLMPVILFFTECSHSKSKEEIKNEIFQTEKAFEKMALEKGIMEAFYYFADENAVIIRENDTLILGKENIRIYYAKKDIKNATVNWTPDFIDVSDCGDIGYTYGNYIWKMKKNDGNIVEFRGIFHTVWKRQDDNGWKYVWD